MAGAEKTHFTSQFSMLHAKKQGAITPSGFQSSRRSPMSKKLSLLIAAIFSVGTHVAVAATTAEKCLTDDQTWTPPPGLTTIKRLVVVGGGAAGGLMHARGRREALREQNHGRALRIA